jgi:glycosyltransferase involved in cell wall biosynthesis
VFFLSRKPYEQVAEYMAACDVLIMPWNQSEWIKACNPIKLKEYLAVGRPVVSTPFAELDYYEDVVTIAENADEFVNGILQSLNNDDPEVVTRRRKRVENETWTYKAQQVRDALDSVLN